MKEQASGLYAQTMAERGFVTLAFDTPRAHRHARHLRYFSETAYANAAQPKELMIIPGAVHTDLYDRVAIIPFDKLAAFFRAHLV